MTRRYYAIIRIRVSRFCQSWVTSVRLRQDSSPTQRSRTRQECVLVNISGRRSDETPRRGEPPIGGERCATASGRRNTISNALDLPADRSRVCGRSQRSALFAECRTMFGENASSQRHASKQWHEPYARSGRPPHLAASATRDRRRACCDSKRFRQQSWSLRTGAAITVVTNAASVDADAGSIRYVATVIAAPVLNAMPASEPHYQMTLGRWL